jgi:hypothetical protein
MDSAVAPIARLHDFQDIRSSLAQVQLLREQAQQSAALAHTLLQLKTWQSQRFEHSYADLRQQAQQSDALDFFLTELYSSANYAERDAQFARIASKLEKLFPASVVSTAQLLARLHALSEHLDVLLARELQNCSLDRASYGNAWRSLCARPGYAAVRQEQLHAVIELGRKLATHTRTPGLRAMLRMMRAPAKAAGLMQLQHFLERGFDTFAQLCKAGQLDAFLAAIAQRESAWLSELAGSST